ncbi:MAG: tetratricopeptide repeat protein [Hyphomicrobiaceae bacterium]
MAKDAQGHELSAGNGDAARHLDDAVRAYILAYGDLASHMTSAREAAPGCPMVMLMQAWLLALSNDRANVATALRLLDDIRAATLNEREAAHLAALEQVVAGSWEAGVHLLERHLMAFPHDILAHQAALRLDGFLGRFHRGAARSARALPLWSKNAPGYGMLISFYGFGLEEAGDYGRAEDVSRAAAELEPTGYWPHHAVSHVLEMTGRPREGLVWMDDREALWAGRANTNQIHIHWHKALFHVELGETEAALALCDGPILSTLRPVGTSLCNVSALLLRLEMLGADVGARWADLARRWEGSTGGSVFNDIHAAIAYLRAGDSDAFGELCRSMQTTAETGRGQAPSYRTVGLPVVHAFEAFERGSYREAMNGFLAARFDLERMGGSKAQRDVVEWALAEAAIRGGARHVALALANERLASRPASVPNQRLLARAEAIAA